MGRALSRRGDGPADRGLRLGRPGWLPFAEDVGGVVRIHAGESQQVEPLPLPAPMGLPTGGAAKRYLAA